MEKIVIHYFVRREDTGHNFVQGELQQYKGCISCGYSKEQYFWPFNRIGGERLVENKNKKSHRNRIDAKQEDIERMKKFGFFSSYQEVFVGGEKQSKVSKPMWESKFSSYEQHHGEDQ